MSEEKNQDAVREGPRAVGGGDLGAGGVKETCGAILAFMVFLFLFTLYNVGVFDRQI